MPDAHIQDELVASPARVAVQTRYGPVTGGKAKNGAIVFLEIPYALPPGRFEDPKPLPLGYRYEAKEYIFESAYGVQPLNDGQAAGIPFSDKVGLGQPTENPLFLNIFIPPAYPPQKSFPVKVYIHGGFLQFGSPHSLSSQAQFLAEGRDEVWVNIGYRLSAFGFLASDKHGLSGNYGFKDQWLALEWVKDNVASFGGDPTSIQISGLSAGAHSVHQLMHHALTLPDGVPAPFTSAVLQSNAMLTNPKTPRELRPQFKSLCRALGLDPDAEDVVEILKDPARVPWASITKVIEDPENLLGLYGTFRGCLSEDWIQTSPRPMERQRDGSFARELKKRGVAEEWYLYSIAHPITSPDDLVPNLERYFSSDLVAKLMKLDRGGEDVQRRFGELLSLVQVHLPVHILARDLAASGFPVLRYQIRWTPPEVRPLGYVTHGTDRVLWALRLPSMTEEQQAVARRWLDAIEEGRQKLASGEGVIETDDQVLILDHDTTVKWEKEEQEVRERYERAVRELGFT
ncbi:alpha/beta-hydrolase [Coprinellus micaceus]|uniref:Carboxylic ester hydrolase n=1 Tax=Coprinellus micaceus TaxID=71717 RepID=A0A4Y7TGM9_COPMI|nr:alpha/beta-hydrolase [Coprinellus micaceus]